MSATLMPLPKIQFFGTNGAPLASGLLYTYHNGQLGNPKATYTDAAMSAENTNPVLLDSQGRASVWLDGTYSIVLKDGSGNTIYTQNNVSSGISASSSFVLIDASITPSVVIVPSSLDRTYIKVDASATPVTLVAPDGYSFPDDITPTISVQYESITVRNDDSTIYIVTSSGSVVPFFSNYVTPVSPTSAMVVFSDARVADEEITLDSANTEYLIARSDFDEGASAHIVTIYAPDGYTVDGGGSYILYLSRESVRLLLVGTDYMVIG